ncbi:MAG TPA: YceI family protein [Vicinamibacterales bacterium]|jgi:polyisoprenoid-binding protein YceI|nr:YceI family protein [Vicinamibacterales bacterium]
MRTATAVAGPVTTWNIDPSHALIEFAVRHLMISTVKGRFTGVHGSLRTDESDRSKSELEVTIDAASIDTREAQRDAHLRSADFLDVETFPTLTFRSRRVIEGSASEFKLAGDLTVHGVTREVILDVTEHGRVTDPWGGQRVGYTATTSIKRSDFGLTWNVALETGGFVVGDDVKIVIELEVVKA